MTATPFQDDFHREVERQSKELRCNDRERARGQSDYIMCIECGTGPCIEQTAFNRPSPTQIAPATDEQIGAMLYDIEHEGCSGVEERRVRSLIARIKAEREQTIRECATLCNSDATRSVYTDFDEGVRFAAEGIQENILSLNGEDK